MIKKIVVILRSQEMKTKTGKLLMMQGKAKSNQLISADPQHIKIFNAEETSPVKINSLSYMESNENKNKYGNEELIRQNNNFQQQLTHLRQENGDLCKEIQKLKIELQQSYANYNTLQNQTQKCKQKAKKSQQKAKKSQQTEQNSRSDQKQSYQKTNSKLQQKCSALEVQNYRLIQTNYLLLLNVKKNLKLYKECLVRIVKKIQGLQFAQASKEIYKILSTLKHDENHAEGLERQFFPHKKDRKKKQEENKSTLLTNCEKSKMLSINSGIYNIQHQIEQNIEKAQNSIQIQLKKLPHNRLADHSNQPHQSSSFQLINVRNGDSDFFPHSNKLFSSQIHQDEYEMIGLDRISLQEKIESDWDHGVRKQATIHKCHGNSLELYKMLMLQAMAIEGFF